MADGRSLSTRVGFARTPLHFGGGRLWFACPRCFQRCRVHFAGYGTIGCRRCLQLSYASQSESPRDRADRAIAKIERRLITRRGRFYKPKGMSWRTFHRLCDRHDHHSGVLNEGFVSLMLPLLRRIRRPADPIGPGLVGCPKQSRI